MKTHSYPIHCLVIGLVITMWTAWAGAAEFDGRDIVQRCNYKFAGNDQRSRLTIDLTDKEGHTAHSEYLRLWKNYQGKQGITDKVILFGQSPLDIRGVNFMRWGYTNKSGKLADQWVYLPEMNRVRRVSQRDPSSADWGFTDEDLRIRNIDEDTHRFIEIAQDTGEEFYVVESTPHEESAYGKWVTRFSKTANPEDCAPRQVDYFDNSGKLIKQEFLTWKKINGAWVWEKVVVKNLRDNISATYQMVDTQVNVGLSDRLFTERQLQRGYPDFNR